MASAFWILEDGRGFARRWSGMAHILELLTDELKTIKGAEEFYKYLKTFVYSEENGDTYNGYGGFIRGNEDIMFNFDLRTFTPDNRKFFWVAVEMAFTKLKTEENSQHEGIIVIFTTLLDMHERINKGEDPMLLNHLSIVEPKPVKKLGPGW